ncbi:MAG TPA: PEP-CTERM sorting domain-containing protein [Candidatus Didemnitutus sp.]
MNRMLHDRVLRLGFLLCVVVAGNTVVLGQTVISGPYDGATIPGDIAIAANTSATFTSGTTFTGTAATIADNATLNWNQDGTLSAKTFTMGSGSNYGTIYAGSGNSLVLDSGTSLTGDVQLAGNVGATVTNQGTISHTYGTGYLYAPTIINQGAISGGANSTLYFGYYGGESVTNAAGGTITADGANANLYLFTTANLGTVTAQNGGALFFTGSYTTANLGTVQIGTGGGRANLQGTLDNTSATLTAPSGGVFQLLGGTITNGTVAPGALTFTNSNGTLSNVTLNDNLVLGASTVVTFTNGTTFTGATGSIADNSTLYWNQNGTLSGKAITMGSGSNYGTIYAGSGDSLVLDGTTSLTGDVQLAGNVGATVTNQGTISHTYGTGYLYAPTLINQGAISAGASSHLYFGYYAGESVTNAAGGTITANGSGSNVYLTSLVNQGTLTAQNNGALNLQSAATNLGQISLQNGTLNTNNFLTNAAGGVIGGIGVVSGGLVVAGGTIDPGPAVGTLTFANGAFSVTGSSTLNIDISGASADQILFQNPTGVISLGNGLLVPNITLLAAPTPATTYNIFLISAGGSGFSGFLNGLPSTGGVITADYLGNPYTFDVTYLSDRITFESIPEPATPVLLGMGLAVLSIAGFRRRRSSASARRTTPI